MFFLFGVMSGAKASAPVIPGDFALTEDSDVAAFAGALHTYGTFDATEASDVAAFAAAIDAVPSYTNDGATGNRTGTLILTGNIGYAGGFSNAKWIDGTKTDQGWLGGGQTAMEMIIDFHDYGYKQVMTAYRVYGANATSQGTFKVQGWNGSAYVDVATGLGFSGNGAGFGTPQEFAFVNTTAYERYKIVQTAGSSSSGPDYAEIEFKVDKGAAVDVATKFSNALGKGARTSSIDVFGNIGANNALSQLIDNNYANQISFDNAQSGKHIIFDFTASGYLQCIDALMLYASNATSQGTFSFQGWNGTAWANIATGLDYKPVSDGQFIPFSNTNYYIAYRILFTAGSTSNIPYQNEIEFRILQGSAYAGRAYATSYANTGGTGARGASINVSGNASYGGGGSDAKWIDGTTADQGGYFGNGQSSRYIEFDLAPIGAKCIDAFKLYASSGNSQGVWTFSGWNGSAWVDLSGGGINLYGGTTGHEYKLMNEVAYSKYRLDQISGSTSSGPNQGEIEFKISA